ncbi:hypothetical protein [Saccharothrix hoggarensis]|uniref:Uncharacterized protein n=1 Tax=Saccharothrix hoggarensis TaxID=913853 RepID=A0ABW3QF97_9PSEU
MTTNIGRSSRLPKKARLAADRAQEQDRVWFAEHPGHGRYCRWALPREWDHDPFTGERLHFETAPEHWSATDRANARVLVHVTQVYEGARFRQPLFGLRPPITAYDVPEVLWPSLYAVTTAHSLEQGLDDFWRWLAYWGDRVGTEVEPWLLEAEAMGLPVRRVATTER